MATTIVTKSGSGAPTASDLVAGELAVDLTNKRLYTENSGGTVLELGTNPASDVTFGDNTKAVFGAGSDLQIYHDGGTGDSIIAESGAGNLFIRGANTFIQNPTGSSTYMRGIDGGAVDIRYAGVIKLATTATGIDVTGSVTADGLTVDGQADFESGASLGSGLNVNRSGHPSYGIVTGGNTEVYHAVKPNGGSWQTYMKVTDGGDISFYEDTGTTPKFFWDASAERLGLGTTSPARDLHIVQNDNWAQIRLEGNSSGGAEIMMGDSTTESKGRIQYVNGSNHMRFDTNATERMRLDASGSLLVGTTDASIWNNTTGNGINLNGGLGLIASARTNAEPLMINRMGTDGEIIKLNKDGATVGSIGTTSGDLTISSSASSHAGLRFSNSNILPLKDGALSAGGIDLGQSSGNYGFKDLYLSTNVYQGATTPSSSAAGVTTEAVGRVTYSRGSGTGGFGHVTFINGNGTVGSITTASSATSYNTSSDQRLKENIADADDAGAKIDAIQVRKYDWKADGAHQDYGMIAQELQVVAPEAVSGDPDSDEMMGVDYSKLVPMMLKEIQSLRARIAALES